MAEQNCNSHHGHHHNITAESREELTALLEYSVHHNASHIEELIQIAGRFAENGNPAVSEGILAASEELKKGNALLEETVKSLK